MAEEQKRQQADEVDLGQILTLILSFFHGIGTYLLRGYSFFYRNIRILIALITLGVAIGVGLRFLLGLQYEQEVIVRPNLDSEAYLTDKVTEINQNLKTKDSIFLSSLGISSQKLLVISVESESIGVKPTKAELEEDLKFMNMLERFKDEQFILDLVKAEISKKSSLHHRLHFRLKSSDEAAGDQVRRILEYINANDYYRELVVAFNENARSRIATNEKLIEQIDELIAGYTDKISRDKQVDTGRFVLEQEEQLDITGLLRLKNDLIGNTENKRIELERRDAPITVIHPGRIRKLEKPIYFTNYFLAPIILVGLFLVFHLLKGLNRQVVRLEGE